MPTTAADLCRVWVWQLDQPPDVERRLRAHLSPQEAAQAARFVDPLLAARYAVAHGFMREILGVLTAVPPDALEFGTGEHGKPFLLPSPQAAHGSLPLRFNLSHTSHASDAWAAVAVNPLHEIGVDIELIRPIDLDLAQSMTEDEQGHLDAEAAEERTLKFYRIWTLKEAALKASGHGLAAGLECLSVIPEPLQPKVGWTRAPLPAAHRFQLASFDAAASISGALAVLDQAQSLAPVVRLCDPKANNLLDYVQH